MVSFRLLAFAGILCAGATAANAALIVDAIVTPLGGSFRYDFSITNTILAPPGKDVVVVNINDGPVGDPLIDPTLIAPSGFLPVYDSGLGIVTFLADTSDFAVGTTVTGFSFESLAAPTAGVFSPFDALTFDGDFITGNVNFSVQQAAVPEPASLVVFGLTFAFGAVVLRLRRRQEAGCASGIE